MITHLTAPSEDVLKAFVRLEDNSDFQTIVGWLKNESDPVILVRMRRQKDEIALRWAQGASQVIADLSEVSVNALSWLEQKYTKQQPKKED